MDYKPLIKMDSTTSMLSSVPLYLCLASAGTFCLLWLASSALHQTKRWTQFFLLIAAYSLLLEIVLTLYLRITGYWPFGSMAGVGISLVRGGAGLLAWPMAAIGALEEVLRLKRPPARQSEIDPSKVNGE